MFAFRHHNTFNFTAEQLADIKNLVMGLPGRIELSRARGNHGRAIKLPLWPQGAAKQKYRPHLITDGHGTWVWMEREGATAAEIEETMGHVYFTWPELVGERYKDGLVFGNSPPPTL